MKFVTLMSAFAAVSAIGMAHAQGGPGGQPGQGGPGGGHQMGMHRMPPMGGPMLLLNPKVVAELKLTSDQIDKIQALHPPRRMGGQGGQGGHGSQGGQARGPEQMQKMHEEMKGKLKEILTADQFTRFMQIELQAMGPMAVMRPDVAKELGLSNDQTEKLQSIMKAHREAMRGRGHAPETGEEAPSRQSMEAMHNKLKGEIMGVLTDEQKSKWESMLGKPFKLPMMGRIPRGGPQGGPGGRGGQGGLGSPGGGPEGEGGGPGGPGGPPSGGDEL